MSISDLMELPEGEHEDIILLPVDFSPNLNTVDDAKKYVVWWCRKCLIQWKYVKSGENISEPHLCPACNESRPFELES